VVSALLWRIVFAIAAGMALGVLVVIVVWLGVTLYRARNWPAPGN